MLLVILAVWFGYKKAKESGRNPYLWAFICAAVFLGSQLLTGLLIGGLMGIGVAFFGWPEDIFDRYSIAWTLIAIVVSIGSLLMVFRYLDKVPDEDPAGGPPPPPTFGDNS